MNLLVSKPVKSQKTEKSGPTHEPRHRAKISLIIAIQPFYGCQQNARKKYYRYCVG